MTLRLSYFVPPTPHVVARDAGLLASIDVSEQTTTGSEEQFEGLKNGTIDVAVTAIDNLYEWVPRGADVVLAGQVELTTPLSLMSRPGITSLDQLQGRVVGVDAFANGFALLARTIFRDHTIDVQFVEVGGVRERYQALLAGDVDATLLGPPLISLALETGMVELVRVPDLFPTLPGQGLVVRRPAAIDPEFRQYVAELSSTGLLPVNPEGLELLRTVRDSLGLLPADVRLPQLVIPFSPTA